MTDAGTLLASLITFFLVAFILLLAGVPSLWALLAASAITALMLRYATK